MKKNELDRSMEDIDFKKIFIEINNNKYLILKTNLYFILITIIFLLFSNKIYEASSTFYPHYENTSSSNLENIAGIAGIQIDQQAGTSVPITLYPNLISSIPFKENILGEKVPYKNNFISYYEYLLLKNKTLLKSLIKKIKNFFLKSDLEDDIVNLSDLGIFSIDEEKFNIHQKLDEIILINVNEFDNYIELYVYDEDPLVAAIIAKKAETILQNNIIDHKIKNVKSLYEFSLVQYEKTKYDFYKLQDSIANFKDRNLNIKSDFFKNQLDRLVYEFNVLNSVYNEISLNKERTAIDVQKNTPIFTIIKPVSVPIDEYYPNKILFLISSILSATLASILYIFVIKKLKLFFN